MTSELATSELTEADRYCLFQRGGMLFALPAACVLEVAPDPMVVAIPAADPVLAGMAHLRNEFLPVIELNSLTGEGETREVAEQQLIVVKSTQASWALLVDRVNGLEQLEVSNRQDNPSFDDWNSAIVGSAAVRDEVTRILNPNALYQFAESTLRRTWVSAVPSPSMSDS